MERIIAYLKSSSVSLYEVAKGIGVSWATVNNWVTGKHRPSAKHIEALANYLRLPVTDIVTGKFDTKNNLDPCINRILKICHELDEQAKEEYRSIGERYLLAMKYLHSKRKCIQKPFFPKNRHK